MRREESQVLRQMQGVQDPLETPGRQKGLPEIKTFQLGVLSPRHNMFTGRENHKKQTTQNTSRKSLKLMRFTRPPLSKNM